MLRKRAILLAVMACGGCDAVTGTENPDYTGDFSGPLQYSVTSRVTCSSTYAVTGRVELVLDQAGEQVSGEGTVFVVMEPGIASPQGCGSAPFRRWDGSGSITGTAASLGLAHEYTANGVMTVTTKTSFAGTLSGETVTGVVSIQVSGQGMPNPPMQTTESGTASFNVTLRKR